MRIKSITGAIHDTSYGGYPYKIIVKVEIDVKEFNKICPIYEKSRSTICGHRPARRDLGTLVVQVNNAVYALNSNIPAYNPSIDSNGGQRARGGIKTLEFVYFLQDHATAERLGFEILHLKNGEHLPKYGQHIKIQEQKGQAA